MTSRNPRRRRNRPNRLGFETLEARAVLAAFMMPTEIAAPDTNEEVGMLLPAVQKVREAAARQTSVVVEMGTDEDAAAHGAGGGGGAGKVSVHDISITKNDAPGDLTDGTNEAVDAIYDLIGQQDEETYLQYKLKDCLVSSWA